MADVVIGLFGAGDWNSGQEPEDYRQAILKLYPNGDAPITAMLSMANKDKTDSAIFHWWTQALPTQGGSITDVYTDAAMSSAYSGTSASKGDTLYVKCGESLLDWVLPGTHVALRDTTALEKDITAEVVDKHANGSNSRITVRLLEDDSSSHALASANYLVIIGNVNAQGGPRPDAIAQNPTLITNYCGISRAPLSLTRTAMQTEIRTPDQYRKAKQEALDLMGQYMEKELLYSAPSIGVGDNGKRKYTTGGMLYHIRTYASSNIYNYKTAYSGSTWLQHGREFMRSALEQVFKYGSDQKIAVCGPGALSGLEALAENYGYLQLRPGTAEYGIRLRVWESSHGTLLIKRHPMFAMDATMNNAMLIFEPKNIVYRYVQDIMFKPSVTSYKKSDSVGIDGIFEEYLAEYGYEFHYPQTFAFLYNVGVDA